MNTMIQVKNILLHHDGISLNFAARLLADQIDGVEWQPWAGRNVITIDGEFYEVAWINRKHSGMKVREAEPKEF